MNQARTARDRLDRALTIMGRMRRFVAPALALLVLGSGAAVGYAMIAKRVFKSETLILYREGIRGSDIGAGEESADRARKLGLRLKEMVLSRTRLEQIIKENHLYPDIVEERGVVEAVDEMRRHITFRVQDGDTFGLGFEGDQPKRVQQVTAKLADAFIAENSKSASEVAGQTKEFLDREKARIEAELKDKETALAQFRAKHPEFGKEAAVAAQAKAPPPKPAAGAGKNDAALASLEREAQRLQERLGQPVKAKAAKQEPQVDPQLAAAKQQAETELAAAIKEVNEKQAAFTEEHPDVRAARAKFKVAQEKARRAGEAYAASLAAAQKSAATKEEDDGYIDRGALENQLKRIRDEIAEYKRRRAANAAAAATEAPTPVASSVVALETEWTRLNREVADARERFGSLQDKEFKAQMVESAAATGNTAQIVVIDPAFVPTHAARPRRVVIAGVGAAIAVVLSLLLALTLALLDDRLYDRVDVERLDLLPLLGVVPSAKRVKRG